jgi:hypothetical protein
MKIEKLKEVIQEVAEGKLYTPRFVGDNDKWEIVRLPRGLRLTNRLKRDRIRVPRGEG